MNRRVLVVDDDRLIREMTRDALTAEGMQVEQAASGPEALARLDECGPFGIVLTDLSMREMDGLELLQRIKRVAPKTDVIILTAYASLESALEAMRLGAADYLRKPVKPPEILYCVKRTLLRRRVVIENEALRRCLQALESARVLTACLEASDVLPLTLDLLVQLLERPAAVARLVDPGHKQLPELHLRGFPEVDRARFLEKVCRAKLFDPADLDTAGGGTRAEIPEALASFGLEEGEALALPIRSEGRIIGGIWLFSCGRAFEPDEIQRAELLVAQAELALVNAERFLQAREKAFIDDVTDLYNVRYLMSSLDREVSRAGRSDLELSVVFVDLDRFKCVNDCHGHLVGSRILRELGALLQESVRKIDTVARYGGDEFTLILVDTSPEGARRVAERIREAAAAHRFGAERGLELSLTLSAGVASFPRHARTREGLLDLSDQAMYLAKARGRNRVCTADDLD
ncbi:MAG: diguanylate cyclase [Myxococcota bacterium]